MQRFTKHRWFDLWQRLKGKEGDSNQVFERIFAEYSAAPRVYHSAKHVDFCLAEFDQVRELVPHPHAVELGLVMHDIAKTEAESAKYLIELGNQYGLHRETLLIAVGIVLATDHNIPYTDFDKQYAMDIDLAILGQPVELFDEYDRMIREEYRHFSDADYRKGRLIVLNKFLRRGDRIFLTPSFKRRYGQQAKQNLVRAIARLSS